MGRIQQLLANDSGIERRVYCMIDGIEPVFWARANRPMPWGGYYRTGLECLIPPESEWSTGLDLARMETDASALTITLDDIADPDDASKSYFGKLFAPGRWRSSAYAFLSKASETDSLVLSTDTTLYTESSVAAFSTAGDAHIGNETFSYTGRSSSTVSWEPARWQFTGVTRGVYPCIGRRWARTIRMPATADAAESARVLVSSVPYTWLGRRVALYVTAYDPSQSRYLGHGEALLLWAGIISSEVSYDPNSRSWRLVCENALATTKRKLFGNVPTAKIAGINLGNAEAARLRLYMRDTSNYSRTFYRNVQVTPGWYASAEEIVKQIQADIITDTTAAWYYGNDQLLPTNPNVYVSLEYDAAEAIVRFSFWVYATIADPSPDHSGYQYGVGPVSQGAGEEASSGFSHLLQVLGFRGEEIKWVDHSGDGTSEDDPTELAGETVAAAYHPGSTVANGGYVYVTDDELVPLTQGDPLTGASDCGWLIATKQVESRGDDKAHVVGVTARATVTGLTAEQNALLGGATLHKLTIAGSSSAVRMIDRAFWSPWSSRLQAKYPEGDKALEPPTLSAGFGFDTGVAAERGPFVTLLRLLLSTGNEGYNGPHDLYAPEMGAGLQRDLVDAQSFLDADTEAIALSAELARRACVLHEPMSWMDLFQRESQLYGMALVWSDGKIRVRSLYSQRFDTVVDTLDDTNGGVLVDRPVVSMRADTVINAWEITAVDQRTERKTVLRINDVESIAGMGRDVAVVDIEHNGLDVSLGAKLGQLLGEKAFARAATLSRFPWWIATRTLSPAIAARVHIGDVVRLQSAHIPDPAGTGAMGVDALALVLDRTLSFTRFDGACTLYVYSGFDTDSRRPWAPSALVDRTATDGGWDSTNKRLTLVANGYGIDGDTEDGYRFSDGDVVTVTERAPADRASPQSWAGLVVDRVFEADGVGVLTLTGAATLTGFDTTGDTEYVVIPDVYTAATTSQQAAVAWLADDADKLVDGDSPQRFG